MLSYLAHVSWYCGGADILQSSSSKQLESDSSGHLNKEAIIAASCSVKGLFEPQAELLLIPPAHREINLLSLKNL